MAVRFTADYREGNIFNIPFANQAALSTGGNWDLFVLTADAGSRVEILDINLGQLSSGSAGVQSLAVMLMRGSTAGGNGATVTAVNAKGWTGAPTAVTSATGPSSALSSTASASLVYADAMEATSGKFRYRPNEEYGVNLVLAGSQRLTCRVTTPQSSSVTLTISGTVTIKELGRGAPN